MNTTTDEVDVVVVGAGLAGLAAAYRLDRRGLRTTVLEASGRIGGRTRSELVDGRVVDFGAEWLGPRHTNLQGLVGEFGLRTEPARMLGHPIVWRGASSRRVARTLRPHENLVVAKICWRLGRLARELDAHEPWASPRAAALDRQSLGEWLSYQGVGGDVYRYISAMVAMLTGTSADGLSLLQVLWWFARGGGPVAMARTTFAQRITGGTQSIADALATTLGARVQLNNPVTEIAQNQGSAAVRTADGTTVQARRVIATGVLDTKAPIAFDPPLPRAIADLDVLRIAPGLKVSATLPDGYRPHQTAVIGGVPLGGAWRKGAQVTGFTATSCDAPDSELIADLAACFDVSVADLRNPVIYRWSSHPSIGGCDIAFAPGELTEHGPYLLSAHGVVDFAGAERSSWPNNMEGAVESGNMTAAKVAQELTL